MFDEAERRVYGELRGQALAVEENPVAPGEPTLRGWLRAMIDRIVVLEARVEELESRSPGQ
jgi:hypothetical protein